MGEHDARRVVIVEDDDDIRRLMETVLDRMGYVVIPAVRGEEAIESVRAHAPDLVTLDMGLPGIDGVEVLKRLREFFHGPVVMVSARACPVDTERALAAGADGYLVKPFRPRTLRADLERIVQG